MTQILKTIERLNNEKPKSFAVFETVLILVVVVVISGIGWFALHTKHQTDKILFQADKISQSTPVTSKNIAASSPTKTKVNPFATYELANKAVSFSYDDNEWQVAKDWSGSTKLCGQTIISRVQCLDSVVLILKKDGEVNPDQFLIRIGVFAKSDSKNVAEWFADDVGAVDGPSPTHSYLETSPNNIYA